MLTGATEDGVRWRVRTGWNHLLSSFERVSRVLVAVQTAVVHLLRGPALRRRPHWHGRALSLLKKSKNIRTDLFW
jgi:hypothetical protein